MSSSPSGYTTPTCISLPDLEVAFTVNLGMSSSGIGIGSCVAFSGSATAWKPVLDLVNIL